jgi:MFS family permease
VVRDQGDDTRPDGVLAGGRRALTLGLVVTITLVGFEGLAVSTVLPSVSDDLGGIGLYGWVFSAFFLGGIIGIVAAGRDADRKGPARPFVAGLVFFAVGLLAAGGAPSMFALVVARFVQGIGAGAVPAVAYVAIGRAYPSDLQARMFAVLSTAWVLPGVIGPAISGAVADLVGWRWVFLGLLPLVLLAGGVTTRALHAIPSPGGDEPPDRRVDSWQLTVGAACVLGGLTSIRSGSFIAAAPLITVGFLVGGRAFVRLMPVGTLRAAHGLPAAVGLRGILTFAFFGTDAFVTLTLTSEHNASATLAGLALTAGTLTWTAGAWVQERRVMRYGPQVFVRVGSIVIAAGIGLMIIVALVSVPIAVAVIAWGIAGFGMGLAYAPIALVVLAEAPKGGEGTATAALQLNDTLGIALGTGVAGAIVAGGDELGWTRGGALAVAFAVCVVFAIAAASLARQLPRTVAETA